MIKTEIRKQFQDLINDRLLHLLWLHIAELFSLMGESNLNNANNPVVEQLSPILECYFIIFQIMHDDDAEFLKSKKNKLYQNYNINTKATQEKQKSISVLGSIESMEEMEKIKQRSFEFWKQSTQFTQNELIIFIGEKAKQVLNLMIKQKLREIKQNQQMQNGQPASILSEPLGIVFKRIPYIIDFENKKQFFKIEIRKLKVIFSLFHFLKSNYSYFDCYAMKFSKKNFDC